MTKNDGLGDFGGTVRVTNGTGSSASGLFTVTLFNGGQQIATMHGSAQGVAAGNTVTVTLISSDKYVSVPYTYQFQTDLSS